jgi:predicted dithiol-disulfide oxidoreductase (DUF899 family)
VLGSRAQLAQLTAFKERMGWTVPWFSSGASNLSDDLVRTADGHETFGLSVFLREGADVFRSYFTDVAASTASGGDFNLLDRTPYGRQEDWEDSPDGWPRTRPYVWWRHHDE